MVKQCRKGTGMNNTIKYATLYLNHIGKDAKAISKELEIKLTDVKKILSSETIKQEKQPTTTTAKNLMINQTSGKGNKTVSIMTRAASEQSDANRKNLPSAESRISRNAIYRPKQ